MNVLVKMGMRMECEMSEDAAEAVCRRDPRVMSAIFYRIADDLATDGRVSDAFAVDVPAQPPWPQRTPWALHLGFWLAGFATACIFVKGY